MSLGRRPKKITTWTGIQWDTSASSQPQSHSFNLCTQKFYRPTHKLHVTPVAKNKYLASTVGSKKIHGYKQPTKLCECFPDSNCIMRAVITCTPSIQLYKTYQLKTGNISETSTMEVADEKHYVYWRCMKNR
jgi:hypothetical protein